MSRPIEQNTTTASLRCIAPILLFCVIAFTAGCSSTETGLQPFTSDGCSLFPDGTFSQPEAWQHCCYQHDQNYWPGGSSKARLLADSELARCVVQAGYPFTAKLMYAGVRAGGTPYLPTPFRWGYGWPWFHNYEH